MTTDELRRIRDDLGMSVAELARVLGVSERTYRRWESNVGRGAIKSPPEGVIKALEHLRSETNA